MGLNLAIEVPCMSSEESALLNRLKGVGGVVVTKFGKRGKPRKKRFRLSDDLHVLRWKTLFKSRNKTSVLMMDVARITIGQKTRQFTRYGTHGKHGHKESRSLSIVYNEGLSNDRFIHREWSIADCDGSNSLDVAEVVKLVRRLNINMDKRYIEQKICEVDLNTDKKLQFDEFVLLMDKLQVNQVLESLWMVLLKCSADSSVPEALTIGETLPSVPPNERDNIVLGRIYLEIFASFMSNIQKQPFSMTEAKLLVKNLEGDGGADNDNSKVNTMGYKTFSTFLTSLNNDVMDPSKEQIVYQDMTQPLCHYWIASSHNTYLEGDQLCSVSSVHRYISDLCKGCRCVELDCWDGYVFVELFKKIYIVKKKSDQNLNDSDDGEPVIYHGHTFTGRIRFVDVIQAVKEYAFQHSLYPVILSLENHCSIPTQNRMANYLVSILGDSLAIPNLEEVNTFPSPESLKHKIIVKGKKHAKYNKEFEETEKETTANGVEDSFEDIDNEVDSPSDSDSYFNDANTTTAATTTQGNNNNNDMRHPDCDKNPLPSKTMKVSSELSDITFLASKKFKGWEEALDRHENSVSSFSENKVEKLLGKAGGKANWVKYNKQQISRIYPSGSRVDSSNYDPLPSWNVSCQLVALNYQTAGSVMRLNDGRFRDNGGCGYILKPPGLRDASIRYDSEDEMESINMGAKPVKLQVTVLSAQSLPKPGGSHKGEIIDPYVQIQLHGSEMDSAPNTFRTNVVNNNGFNPTWDESFTLPITTPDLALLVLKVMDSDVNADDFIAQATFPVLSIREGYRSVALSSSNSTRHGSFQHSSLFCRFSFEHFN